MTFSNEIENVWKEDKANETLAPLAETELHTIVSTRVRKEFKTVGHFVWAAIVYQIILYSFLTHALVRQWGDIRTTLLCLAGAALSIPLTTTFIRRVSKLFCAGEGPGSTVPDVLHKVETDYARLADFFRFKQRMDWIGVPVTCAIIAFVTFTLFVKGGVQANPMAALALFAIWVGMSIVAIHNENRKRFISPLRHLEQILDDLKNS